MIRKNIVKSILFACSALCMFYGLAVVTILGGARFFDYAFIAIGTALALCAVFLDRLLKMPETVKRFLIALLAFFLAFFVVCESVIISYSVSGPEPGADYVIILGAKVNGETPSLEFGRRISTAASYLKENPDSLVVTTGGMGSDEDMTEARAARIRLLTLGIPDERILSEEKSTSTEENLRFAAEVIRQNGGDPANDSVVIVSSSFHLYRAGLHAAKEGFGNLSFSGCTGLKILLPHYYLREFAALAYEAVF